MTEAQPNKLKKKDQVQGKVIKTTVSGALVEIGQPKPALIPISQLRQQPVKKVEEVVKEGDQVTAWVRKVGTDDEHVELTLIKPVMIEWADLKEGLELAGKVAKIEKFGAFVDVGAERQGMVHVSEMSHEYVKRPEDVVKVGDEIQVKVLGVDQKKRQIKLSMKALVDGPKEEVEEVEEPAEPEKPVPTAMEIALRKAMDTQAEKPVNEARVKTKKDSTEMEDILTRTLENKLRSK